MKIEITNKFVNVPSSVIYDLPKKANFSTLRVAEATLYLIMFIPMILLCLSKGLYFYALVLTIPCSIIYFLRFHIRSVFHKRESDFRRYRKIVGNYSAGNAIEMFHKMSRKLKWKCVKRTPKHEGVYITPLSLFSWGEKVFIKRNDDELLVCSMPRPDRPFSIIKWVHRSNIHQVLSVARNA